MRVVVDLALLWQAIAAVLYSEGEMKPRSWFSDDQPADLAWGMEGLTRHQGCAPGYHLWPVTMPWTKPWAETVVVKVMKVKRPERMARVEYMVPVSLSDVAQLSLLVR
jgi:hypothetical protein